MLGKYGTAVDAGAVVVEDKSALQYIKKFECHRIQNICGFPKNYCESQPQEVIAVIEM